MRLFVYDLKLNLSHEQQQILPPPQVYNDNMFLASFSMRVQSVQMGFSIFTCWSVWVKSTLLGEMKICFYYNRKWSSRHIAFILGLSAIRQLQFRQSQAIFVGFCGESCLSACVWLSLSLLCKTWIGLVLWIKILGNRQIK